MSKSIIILGRQPALGLAELESLYGPTILRAVPESNAALLNVDHSKINLNRLGGSLKLAKLLYEFDSTSWNTIQKYLQRTMPEHVSYVPEGKFTLGLSVFGLDVPPKQLLATGLTLKKTLKAQGRSVRLVPNKESALNSAQVLYNKLTSPNGWELIFVRDGNRVLMAQTVKEQDIDAFAARDQMRPKRDALVGMLPPKLAQIIINLATGPTDTVHDKLLLDPFCGTGVILQEAALMGYDIAGSDLEDRMISYSDQNLRWFAMQPQFKTPIVINDNGPSYKLEQGDATNHSWVPIPDVIACETYLGRPFSHKPDAFTLDKVMQDVSMIHKKFLQNVASQTKPGFRLCIAVPAWFIDSGIQHLKTLDSLEELGYTRLKYVFADDKDLIYRRPDQIVGRELVTLIRK